MIVKQVQAIVFSKEEQEALISAANVIGTLCSELGKRCSQCPFVNLCGKGNPIEIIAKLGHDGQLIINN